jgi:hypothetical protein
METRRGLDPRLRADKGAVAEDLDAVERFYMELTPGQAFDLASGYVPTAVQAMAVSMLDWQDADRRRAARPVQPPRKRKRGA